MIDRCEDESVRETSKRRDLVFELLLHNATILIQDQVVYLSRVVARVVLGISCGSCVLISHFLCFYIHDYVIVSSPREED